MIPTARRLSVVVVLLLAATFALRYSGFEEVALPDRPLRGFPSHIGHWRGIGDHTLSEGVLDTLKVSDYVYRDFTNDDAVVSLYIGYYRTHRDFAEIHTPENCQAGSGWAVIDERIRNVDVPGTEGPLRMKEAIYEKDHEQYVFLFWYQVNGESLTSFFAYKVGIIMSSLLRHRTDAAFVRIAIPIGDDDVNDAVRTGEEFLREFLPLMNTYPL